MKTINEVEDIHQENSFILWQEVLLAFVMPTIMAGIGGLFTSDVSLSIRACTSIGGSSAIIAWVIGLWFQKRGIYKSRIAFGHYSIIVALFLSIGLLLGLIGAWITFTVMNSFIQHQQLNAFYFLWIDLPLSSTIASGLIAWRWKYSIHKKIHSGGVKK